MRSVFVVGSMRNNYEKSPMRFRPPEPPVGLFDRIMVRIHEEELLLSVRKRLFLFSITALGSVTAFVPVVNAFRIEFTQSGFGQFFSLLFSDGGWVAAHWQDFGLALLESMPAASIGAFLFMLLVFLWSLKHFIQALKVVFNQQQLMRGESYGL